MAEYTPNSFKPKSELEEAAKKKKPDPIVSATPTVKKKTLGQKFMQTFIAEDLRSVRKAVWNDVIVPKIKEGITNLINETTSRIFYGRPSQSEQKSKSTIYYNLSNGRPQVAQRENKSVYDFNNLVFLNQTDAENVLLRLKLELEHYESVSVGYYYDITNRSSEPTDYKYGWRSLKTARVVSTSEGFELVLPQPTVL